MPVLPSVKYSTFGRHGCVVALRGAVSDPAAREELIAAIARAIEADRTGVVIDLQRVQALDAGLLETLLDVHRAGERHGWRVAVVRPSSGPPFSLFQASALHLSLNLFASRGGALLWTLARRPGAAAEAPAA